MFGNVYKILRDYQQRYVIRFYRYRRVTEQRSDERKGTFHALRNIRAKLRNNLTDNDQRIADAGVRRKVRHGEGEAHLSCVYLERWSESAAAISLPRRPARRRYEDDDGDLGRGITKRVASRQRATPQRRNAAYLQTRPCKASSRLIVSLGARTRRFLTVRAQCVPGSTQRDTHRGILSSWFRAARTNPQFP